MLAVIPAEQRITVGIGGRGAPPLGVNRGARQEETRFGTAETTLLGHCPDLEVPRTPWSRLV